MPDKAIQTAAEDIKNIIATNCISLLLVGWRQFRHSKKIPALHKSSAENSPIKGRSDKLVIWG